MSDREFRLKKGQQFRNYQELLDFMKNYTIQQSQFYSVHKSKTIEAAKVLKKINSELVYYSLHYTCHCSGVFKPRGKGTRKTKSMKTGCPSYIKIKVSASGTYLEVDSFNEEHNHPEVEEVTTGKYLDDCADQADEKIQSGSDILQDKVPDIELCEKSQDNLDIAGLSIYIAQEEHSDEKISTVHINAEDLNVTLPVLLITEVPSNLHLVKTKMSGNKEVTCSISTEEPHFEEDLVAVSKASEFLAEDGTEMPEFIAVQKQAQAPAASGPSPNEVNRCGPVIYSVSTTHPSSIVVADTSNKMIDIAMPPILRSKGRPKAAALTAIGLPKNQKQGSFKNRSSESKARTILSWLIPAEIMENVLLGEYQIKISDIQHLSKERLTDAVVDDAVDLSIVEHYFESQGFSRLQDIVSGKRESDKFTCWTCKERVEKYCVFCDGCLLWHHYRCVQVKRAPKTENWFCKGCRSTR